MILSVFCFLCGAYGPEGRWHFVDKLAHHTYRSLAHYLTLP